MFAELERVLPQTLWAHAETKAEVARIVYSGVNSEQAGNYIIAVAKAINGNGRFGPHGFNPRRTASLSHLLLYTIGEDERASTRSCWKALNGN
jgi:hypothetical protein